MRCQANCAGDKDTILKMIDAFMKQNALSAEGFAVAWQVKPSLI
jgi:hypothetical protein